MPGPDELKCPWTSPAQSHAWEYLAKGWHRGVKDERERLAAWLLEDVTFPEPLCQLPLQRRELLTRECVERYRKTGELRLFEVARVCARCGSPRTDSIESDICGNCADDLRNEEVTG